MTGCAVRTSSLNFLGCKASAGSQIMNIKQANNISNFMVKTNTSQIEFSHGIAKFV